MSSSTTVTIPSNYDIQLGGDGSTIKVDSDLVTQSNSTSDSTAKVDLKIEPLDIKIEPLDIKIEPLKVDTDSKIDVKPLAIDSCQTLKLAPLPPIRIEQPYSQHFGITFMGIELWGINTSGKSEMFLHSPPKQQHYSVEVPKQRDCGEPGHDSKAAFARHPSGLRVRVK